MDPRTEVFFQLPLEGNALAVADNIVAINMAGMLAIDLDLFNVTGTLVGQSFNTINNALLQMDPTPYTTLGATTALISPMLAGFYSSKIRRNHCPGYCGCEERKWSLWAEPFKMHFNQHNISKEDGFCSNATGVAVGLENGLNQKWQVGVGGVYDHLTIRWDHHRGHSHSDNFYGAFFVGREGRHTQFSLAVLGGYDMFSNQRHIRFTTIDRRAESNFHAAELIGEVYGALLSGPEDRRFGIYAAVDSDTLFQPFFKEHGADSLNLRVKKKTTSVLVSEIGLLLNKRWNIRNGCIGPDLWVAYVNETFLTDRDIRSTFINQVIPFTTVGVNRTQNLVEVGITMSYILNNRFTFSGSYSPQFGSRLLSQRGDLQLRWIF